METNQLIMGAFNQNQEHNIFIRDNKVQISKTLKRNNYKFKRLFNLVGLRDQSLEADKVSKQLNIIELGMKL